MPQPPLRRRPLRLRPLAAAAAAAMLVVLAAAACRPTPQEVAADKQEVRKVIEDYAARLSHAYAFTDASGLKQVASQREVASVQRNLGAMAARGQRLATDLKELEIEQLDMSDRNNAYVQTFEVWDIEVMDLGSERVISRDQAQRNRVRYQLKRQDGRWRVLWRQRMEENPPAGKGSAGGSAGGSNP